MSKANLKLIIVLLRLIKNLSGKSLCTFESISQMLGLNSRQDSNNFWRQFLAAGKDILAFLKRKKKLEAAFPLIEKQVLIAPYMSLKEHYREFIRQHPEHKMSFSTFQDYCRNIDTVVFQKQCLSRIKHKDVELNTKRILSEIFCETEFSTLKKKEAMELVPEIVDSDKLIEHKSAFMHDVSKYSRSLLVMFLVACGINFDVLAMLLGVSKGTIHNLFHRLSFLKNHLLSSIVRWSGVISVDEKWLKIRGKWHYVLSAVDNKTGFPLFYTVTTDLKGDTWKLFFQRFYRLYGVPDMIISDGSKALASGLEAVYPNVNHQLCKFHKYKNLLGRIYKIRRGKLRRRCLKLAKGIFNNQSYMGRKRAARQLAGLGVPYVSEYVENNILGCWHKLTKMKTSNASERWNRKIEKVTAKRYGLKTVGFVEQMMAALWLKEVIRDKRHLQNSFIDQVDFPRICQENIKVCNIIDVIKHKLLKSVA